MRFRAFISILLLLACSQAVLAQQTVVEGVVRNDSGRVLDQVAVFDVLTGIGTKTNARGYYMIVTEANRPVTLGYHQFGYALVKKSVTLEKG
ncbi:MAG: hypothetical protein EBZ77_06155, partial [Chitinophagia bacterium]|nr:hypothetical protein [Chitinophagia bacterium]